VQLSAWSKPTSTFRTPRSGVRPWYQSTNTWVILGRNVKKSSIFEMAFNKLHTCVVLFLTVQWSFSSCIQIANIYLYPLISYLLNFFSLSCALKAQLWVTSPNSSSPCKTSSRSWCLTAEQLFYHVCFAKALWKARCQAIWCVNKVSPNYICTLFWEAVSKTKKRAPPLEAQRSVVPLDDIDVYGSPQVNLHSLLGSCIEKTQASLGRLRQLLHW